MSNLFSFLIARDTIDKCGCERDIQILSVSAICMLITPVISPPFMKIQGLGDGVTSPEMAMLISSA